MKRKDAQIYRYSPGTTAAVLLVFSVHLRTWKEKEEEAHKSETYQGSKSQKKRNKTVGGAGEKRNVCGG